MYSAPDFVKISVAQTYAFASACTPEWQMNDWSLQPDCTQVTIEGLESYNCYFNQNASS